MAQAKPLSISRLLRRFSWPILLLVVLVLAIGWWFSPSPQIGQAVSSQGQDHIAVGSAHPEYNSNPPTSGWHYAEPVTAGIYDREYPDENLLHSLEHGYVTISYNCQRPVQSSWFMAPGEALAHGDESEATVSSEASTSAVTTDEDCHKLVDDLKDLGEKLRLWKLIITPRVRLDTRLALTAWGRFDKFNDFDQKRIERFVKFFRDQGPEKTAD